MMRTDVLIIGGGLAGCAAAWYLARAGAEVTLLERHDLNAHASGSNAGSIHAQIPPEPFRTLGEGWARNFAPTIPLMMASIGIWAGLEAELGVDLEFSAQGGILVAATAAQMHEVERKTAIERAQGLAVQLLDRDGLRELAPYVADHLVGGAFCPIEGKANPLRVTLAIAEAAARLGARLLRRTTLQELERRSGGFVATTDRGPIGAGCIIDCAGAEAGQVARLVGAELPIEAHPIQVNVTEPVTPLVPHLVYSAGERLTLKQTRSGAFLIGGGWPARRDPASGRLAVDPCSALGNLAVAHAVVPTVAGARLLRTWPALVNGTADWKPVIGELPGVPGFFLAVFPWMGFTAGPIAARLVSQLVLGEQPDHDLGLFSPERWT